MEIGYDYLLLRSSFQQKFVQASAIFLAVTGAVLVSAGIGYYIYADRARADLDDLNVSIAASPLVDVVPKPAISSEPVPVPVPQRVELLPPALDANLSSVLIADPLVVQAVPPPNDPLSFGAIASLDDEGVSEELSPVVDSSLATAEETILPLEQEVNLLKISASAIAAQEPYPAQAISSTYWNNPLEYEPASQQLASLISSFTPVDPASAPPPGTLSAPTQISIPSIEVDSVVEGLRINNLGTSRAYETPNNVVGHIPEGSNAGESGSAWFFGHLESPLAGEGNVFYDLPKIPDMLRQGEEVYTIVESGSTSYLYRITEAVVVRQEDLRLDYAHLQQLMPDYARLDPSNANIHLVACVPRFVYDHRIVVSGELVGIRQ